MLKKKQLRLLKQTNHEQSIMQTLKQRREKALVDKINDSNRLSLTSKKVKQAEDYLFAQSDKKIKSSLSRRTQSLTMTQGNTPLPEDRLFRKVSRPRPRPQPKDEMSCTIGSSHEPYTLGLQRKYTVPVESTLLSSRMR